MAGFLDSQLSEATSLFGLKLWVVICLCIGAFILLMLLLLSLWLTSRSKSRRPPPSIVIPMEIKEVNVAYLPPSKRTPLHSHTHFMSESSDAEKDGKRARQARPPVEIDVEKGSISPKEKQTLWKMVGEERNAHNAVHIASENGERRVMSGSHTYDKASNVSGGSHSSEFNPSPANASSVPEVSHLGWGHWYTLRDLELATDFFAASNVLGEGGYGMVYRGERPDGSFIAVKNLLNNRGQAEKEFKVEVEAIGRVRHKNLVRLIGYCAEGSHRILVYEFVDNGNLDQWLHGSLGENQTISWEDRMKIVIGTAKGLAYLHEGLEPKVVHRDIKSSNILLDTQWNAKVSDFGLAKLLGAGKSFVTTRVMGTFGYVAPEYANTGLLNERSDVYSFGVLLMEIITGRDPVDYSRSTGEVNLVDWLKTMVGNRRSEELVDPRLEVRPSSRMLKRALLVALRCVDPDAQKRPKMGHVVHMLEADEYPYDERRSARTKGSPRHQASQGKETVIKGSPSSLRVKGSPACKGGAVNEENLELVLESPSGPGYKPSLRRIGT